MKLINGLFIIIEATLLCLSFFLNEHFNFDVAFLFSYLALMFLLALSCRSLTYRQQASENTFIWVVCDLICKISTMFILPAVYFSQHIALFVINAALIAFLILCFIFTCRKVTISNLPELGNDEESKKIAFLSIFNLFAYVLGAVLLWLPNYSKQANFFFMIPFALSVISFIFGLYKFINTYVEQGQRSKKRVIWMLLYFVSLSFYYVVKYLLEVETIISIFTVISILFMLPYFNAMAREVRKNMSINKGD